MAMGMLVAHLARLIALRCPAPGLQATPSAMAAKIQTVR